MVKCFVPCCTSGYKSDKSKTPIFKVPSDEKVRRKWNKIIPRLDRDLTEKDHVCAKHFEDDMIEKDFINIINGNEIRIPRDRWTLKLHAIPTKFPRSLTEQPKQGKKRKPPCAREDQAPSKSRRTKDTDAEPQNFMSVCETADVNETRVLTNLWVHLTNLDLPKGWGRVNSTFPDQSERITFFLPKVRCEDWIHVYWEKNCDTPKITVRCMNMPNSAMLSAFEATKEAVESLLINLSNASMCQGFSISSISEFCTGQYTKLSKKCLTRVHIVGERVYSKQCTVFSNEICLACKYLKKLLIRRKKPTPIINRNKNRKLKRLQLQKVKLQKEIDVLQIENSKKSAETLNEAIAALPGKQQEAVRECFQQCKRGKKTGCYTQEWLLECLLMRIKSPSLYNHLRDNKILALPAPRTLNNYIRGIQTKCGISIPILQCLQEKLKHLPVDSAERHGVIIIDEMSLTPHADLDKTNDTIVGLVDFDHITTWEDKFKMANHGLIVYFQPLKGSWGQAVGFFLTRDAAPGSVLAKIVLDAVVKLESHGLFVDGIVSDGATTNRSMWKSFGVGKMTDGAIKNKIEHPCDPNRSFHFLSDAVHLFKCLRNNWFKSCIFEICGTKILHEHLKLLWRYDSTPNTCGLRVVPRLSKRHIYPSNFEKMSVSLMRQVFSEDTYDGFKVYQNHSGMEGCMETAEFVKKISSLYELLNNKEPVKGLRINSADEQSIKDFLMYLDDWERNASSPSFFLTLSTAEGFRVTILSVLDLLNYCKGSLRMEYLLTSKLTQDVLEHFFGLVRQCNGPDNNPTPRDFLYIVRLLSVYSLARPPRNGNCETSDTGVAVLTKLSTLAKENKCHSVIDKTLEEWLLTDISLAETRQSFNEHDYDSSSSVKDIVHFLGGYVARKVLKNFPCKTCTEHLLRDKPITQPPDFSDIGSAPDMDISFDGHQCLGNGFVTLCKDRGGLLWPSEKLHNLLLQIESVVSRVISGFAVNADLPRLIIEEVVKSLDSATSSSMCCSEHSGAVLKYVIRFYVTVRVHFFLRDTNTTNACKTRKMTHNKLAKN